jgi:hypothetical protein
VVCGAALGQQVAGRSKNLFRDWPTNHVQHGPACHLHDGRDAWQTLRESREVEIIKVAVVDRGADLHDTLRRRAEWREFVDRSVPVHFNYLREAPGLCTDPRSLREFLHDDDATHLHSSA